jgi:hypothetical protein
MAMMIAAMLAVLVAGARASVVELTEASLAEARQRSNEVWLIDFYAVCSGVCHAVH